MTAAAYSAEEVTQAVGMLAVEIRAEEKRGAVAMLAENSRLQAINWRHNQA